MKDVIERLEAVIYQPIMSDRAEYGEWCFDLSVLTDDDAVKLKALISYTKQCEEALRNVADCREAVPFGENPLDFCIDQARQALSLIQQGE